MDIETDSEQDDEEQAVQQQLGVQPPIARSSIFGSPEKVNNSSRRGRLSVAKRSAETGEEEQVDMSMDMDITQIVSHGILQPAGSPASTVSGGSHNGDDMDDSDSDSDEEELNQSRQEERTMDFTVAIGGVIPGAPPANARENRNAVGYTVESTTTTTTMSMTEYSAPLADTQPPRPMYASSIFSIPANRGFDQFGVSSSAVVQQQDEEEMDMEETRAFGGVVSSSTNNHVPTTSIFLPDPDSSMESVEEVDQTGNSRRDPTLRFDNDDTMDFTIAHGGVLDASAGSAVQQDDDESMMEDVGMDFTIARGGILPAVNVTSPTASTISQINMTLSAKGTPKSAQSPARTHGQESQGSTAAPSYAQATSASRARDIYGPSPSPQKMAGDSPVQPKGRSPATAMEVAKKLVFAPSPAKTTTSKRKSVGAPVQGQSKRKSVTASAATSVFNDENAPPPAESQRPTSIFASPAKTTMPKSPMKVIAPSKSPAKTPAKQVSIFGTPKRFAGNTLSLPSPARGLLPSPAKTTGLTVPTIQEPAWEQEQYANIPLANFLAMCNVRFSDDGPGARRKSIAGLPPDLLQEMLARDEEGELSLGEFLGDSLTGPATGGFNLHDYARAQIWKPFYDMYQWGCQQMKRDYEAGQETLESIDREASEDNPPVIRDYLAASDEEKGVFEVSLVFRSDRAET
jgi:kinetochore protein Spc7/SPC105